MDTQLKKGILDICVLKCLKEEDSYGYKIIQSLNQYVDVSESTLYPILKRLEASNCLETYTKQYNNRLRNYYKITVTGKKRIDEFIEEWKEIEKIYDFILKEDSNE